MPVTAKLSASILAADFSALGESVSRAECSGADMIHIDVMDGCFVPPITLGAQAVRAIRPCTKLIMDAHLMTLHPERHIRDFANAGAEMLTVHAEACTHLHRTLQQIREAGMKPGVALNPATPLSVLDYVLEDAELFLLMSVNPGYGGQGFIPAVMDKIISLKAKLDERGLKADISVDGGVSADNAASLRAAGVTVMVAGTAFFGAKDMARAAAVIRGNHQ